MLGFMYEPDALATMFKIGEFSCFSRISVKMLRHYDEIGLLKPAYVDSNTGYRYYLAEQLPRLNLIILFKDLGFSLEQIAQLLDANLTADEIRGVLKLRQSEIQQRMAEDSRRLSQLESALAHLQQANVLPIHPIIVRDVPAQLVASIRKRVHPDQVAPIFDRLEALAAVYKARSFSPPLMIYHATEFIEGEQDVEVTVPLSEVIPASDAVQVYELSGGTMACIVYTGDYAASAPLIQQYPQWLESHHYQAAGPLREVYLRFGADNTGYTLPDSYLTDVPDAFVTELQLPITRRDT